MAHCGVIGGVINTFWKDVVAASWESLFLCKNEKGELSFQVLPCKKSKVGIPSFQICRAFRGDIKYYVIICTEICEDLH